MAKKKTKVITTKPASKEQVSLPEITDLLGGDTELALFFVEWLDNGFNATKAYLKLHPNVTDHTARVVGSRWLAKVDISTVLEAMDLGRSKYLEQLKAGLNAGRIFAITKWDKNGKKVQELDFSQPDHKVRRLYHEALGQMLGVEEKSGVKIQNNQFNFADLGKSIRRDEMARGLA